MREIYWKGLKMKKIFVLLGLLSASCGRNSISDSQSSSVTSENLHIVVNLTTNKLTVFNGAEAIRSWNVGTARAGKTTPLGHFSVKIKERCPVYHGSKGDKNIAGCTPQNPLGPRALWFIDTMFGLHGTSQPGLISDETSADDRRLSAGCIRNNNANILWLFDHVKVGTPIDIIKD